MSTNNIEITVGQKWRIINKPNKWVKIHKIINETKSHTFTELGEGLVKEHADLYERYFLDSNHIIDLLLEKYK